MRWGIIFDRLSDSSFANRMRSAPAQTPYYLERLARLHIAIHRHGAAPFASLKVRLAGRIRETQHLDEARRQSLIEGLIVGDAAEPMVIDWPDACRGDPAADLCPSYLLLALHANDLAAPYLDAYCRLGDISPEAALAWLPYVAAARLAEEVPGEIDGLRELLALSRETGSPPDA